MKPIVRASNVCVACIAALVLASCGGNDAPVDPQDSTGGSPPPQAGGSPPSPAPSDPPAAAPPATPNTNPRVVVLTDINNYGTGDPDDKQSLVHLLWYANELNIRGILPDDPGSGVAAAKESLAAYRQDYFAQGLATKGYPNPDALDGRLVRQRSDAVSLIVSEATAASDPLYVLVWGGMQTLRAALVERPDIAEKIRVLSVASGRQYGDPGNCSAPNFNGNGRNAIFFDGRFDDMWWLENNWTYNGMFDGARPAEMLESLSQYGAMGFYMIDAVRNVSWAQYFRAGDTPTVLFLVDPQGDRNNPARLTWAGLFTKPFSSARPNYYTDASTDINWNYDDPCATWSSMEQMYQFNKSTLGWGREAMYQGLLQKLNGVYGRN